MIRKGELLLKAVCFVRCTGSQPCWEFWMSWSNVLLKCQISMEMLLCQNSVIPPPPSKAFLERTEENEWQMGYIYTVVSDGLQVYSWLGHGEEGIKKQLSIQLIVHLS